MAPKKKEVQKLTLGEFMTNDSFGGSWADEVEETVGTQPLPPMERRGGGSGFYNSSGPRTDDRGFSYREIVPQRIPDRPPYLAHLGNLDYEITEPDIRDFLQGCDVTSIRLIEDRETRRPKGFGYAEFVDVSGLKKALELDGSSFRGRSIKVKIADPPKERDSRGGESRDLGEWTRKGPLPDLPSTRNNDRRPAPDFSERRPPRDISAEDKPRDLTWERKGPLTPVTQPERPVDLAREGGRSDSFRGPRKPAGASWGEGRPEGVAPSGPIDGPRPPREFQERPERPERVPTAADRDMQWRSNMRPDAAVKSPPPSGSGSEAPSSPAPAAAVPASRPKLNLTKRTVSEAPDAVPAAAGDAKASPFGAARPIDTAARQKQVEEKRLIAIQEKKDADERAKEEAKKASEAAAQEAAAREAAAAAAAAEAAEKEEASKEVFAATTAAAATAAETPAAGASEAGVDVPKTAAGVQNGAAAATTNNQRGPRPREPREPREPRGDLPQNAKSRANDSGNWRQSSGDQRGARGPREPRGPAGDGQPRRGGGAPRGPRYNNEGPRPPRANGGPQSQPSTPKLPQEGGANSAVPATPTGPDEEGWETVPNKGRRSQKPRAQ
ncbi:MAG: Eukaryotic translation initiation factor 4B [Sporothrix epigloea]